jgi:hypothetical protein
MNDYAVKLVLYLFSLIADLKDLLNMEYEKSEKMLGLRLEIRETIRQLNMLEVNTIQELLSLYEEQLDENRKYLLDMEFKVELIDAKKFIEGSQNYTPISFYTYRLLIQNERAFLDMQIKHNVRKCLFVGSGPWPLSAIMYASIFPQVTVDLLDSSETALSYSKKVIQKLQLQDKLQLLPSTRVEKFEHLNDYDLIICAAMIGQTSDEKVEIYSKIAEKLNKDKLLLTRTTIPHSFNVLFYAPYPTEVLNKYYEVTYLNHPNTSTPLTQILLKRK